MSEPTNLQLQVIDTPIMLFDGTTVSKAAAGAAAAVLLMPNGRRYTVSQFLSKATDQEAKYQGLIIGLQKAQKLNIRQLDIKGNSEIIFSEIDGSATVSEPQMITLHQQVLKLLRRFEKVSFELIPPEQNRSAITAVNRCIAEALGRESQPDTSVSMVAPQITPNVARLIKLKSKATDKDYRQLTAEPDDFTPKSLSQLRELVPDRIRDEIALLWDGQDEDLTEIYRWYLRGLSPDMAIRKVQIDTQSDQQKQQEEKLPWEGGLLSQPEIKNEDFEIQNPFLPSDFFDSLDITDEENLIFPLSEVIEEDDIFIQNPEIIPTNPPQTISESSLITLIGDENRDTLPSDVKVMHIVELIRGLSLEEKTLLVQDLVKNPDMVNLILKAIAEQMTGR